MKIFRLSISRKIVFLVGFVGIVSGLAGILPLYLGSFSSLERAFSNLLVTSAEADAKQLSDYLLKLESTLNLLDERFLRLGADSISAYELADQEKQLSTFQPLSLKEIDAQGYSHFQTILDAAGGRGYLAVVNSRGRVCANSKDIFPFSFWNYDWWDKIKDIPPTSVYYAQVRDERPGNDMDSQSTYLAVIKPLYSQYSTEEESKQIGAIVVCIDAPDLFMRAMGSTTLKQINSILYSSDGKALHQPIGTPGSVIDTVRANSDVILDNLKGWYWADEAKSIMMAHGAVNVFRLHARDNTANAEWFVIEFIDVSESVSQNVVDLWQTMFLGFVLIILLCLLGAAISYRIVKPMKILHRGVNRLQQGELDHRVKVRTGDELEQLAESFNKMAQALQETYDELENKIRESDEKRGQLTIINEVIKATTQALDPERTFKNISWEVSRLVPYDRLSICFILEKEGKARFAFVIPSDRETLPRDFKVDLDNSLIGHACKNQKPVVVDLTDKSREKYIETKILYEGGNKSVVVVPLSAQSGIIGTINLASDMKNQYGEREIDLLLQVADTLAISIEHANLYTQVARFAENLEKKVRERTAALENAQQKLIQTEKFAATGRLAANIAHEINNPLGIIKNYLYLLSENLEQKTKLGESDDALENLRVIREEIDRIARIVRRLLDFYRQPDSAMTPTDINSEIREMFQLVRKGFKQKNIVVEQELEDDLPRVMASPDKLRQVILNLLRNAEDAVSSENGNVIISTKSETRRDEASDLQREYVVLSVIDNGCGISDANLQQIFDPFFTTKQESGTGLGLSITYGIVESLGGMIEVDTKEHSGTTFRVLLPIEGSEIAIKKKPKSPVVLASSNEIDKPQAPPEKDSEEIVTPAIPAAQEKTPAEHVETALTEPKAATKIVNEERIIKTEEVSAKEKTKVQTLTSLDDDNFALDLGDDNGDGADDTQDETVAEESKIQDAALASIDLSDVLSHATGEFEEENNDDKKPAKSSDLFDQLFGDK